MANELESPPRIDPEQAERRLVDSEHLARYLWARQVVLGSDVLDAGCGRGYGSRILAGAGAARVVGVDIDPDAIDRARSAVRDQTEWLVGDITVLPFAADSFDVVVCFEVIEHLEQQTDALRELHRVLRPEGHLVISSPNRCQYPPGNPHHTHEFTIAEFTRLLQAHFTTVDLYCRQLGSDHSWNHATTPMRTAMRQARRSRTSISPATRDRKNSLSRWRRWAQPCPSCSRYLFLVLHLSFAGGTSG
jgi:SAM-dependent methyltransferase